MWYLNWSLLANKILFFSRLWVCQNIYKIIMILELITDYDTLPPLETWFLNVLFFVPEEGMTGGGTGGRDLARSENAEEDSECWLTATRADITSLDTASPPHIIN